MQFQEPTTPSSLFCVLNAPYYLLCTMADQMQLPAGWIAKESASHPGKSELVPHIRMQPFTVALFSFLLQYFNSKEPVGGSN